MSNRLETYQAKRDFSATTEPRGALAKGAAREGLKFVVQRHEARALHFDFRLEVDGVLKSWAVPKGPSTDPDVKRLAVETEDHPLAYADFAGTIPKGNYGAGKVEIWDSGSWTPQGDAKEGLARGRLKFELAGKRLAGTWVLLRIRSGNQWLLRKVDAQPGAQPSVAPVVSRVPPSVPPPKNLAPMLATLVERAPEDGDWAWEIKYDGYRMLCRIGDGAVRFLSRNGLEWTAKFGALAERIARSPLGRNGSGWIDGEIVVFDKNGLSDFQALQAALDGAAATPVFVVFDVLQWDGEDLRDRPYSERAARLDALLGNPGSNAGVQRSEPFDGDADTIWKEACRLGFEGLIGKRVESPYRAGRSRDWIKLKCRPRQEVVIGGYSEPAGARSDFGALLVGVREGKKLRYAGRVGTGFTQASLAALRKRLDAIARKQSPFDDKMATGPGRVHWVEPTLVAEVSFANWTEGRALRQASFEGLREDKAAVEVTRERAKKPAELRSISQSAARPRAGPSATARRSQTSNNAVAGVTITHPERLVFRTRATTKLQLAQYYERVAPAFFAELKNRPLSLLRCPDGADGKCFFQKHLQEALRGIVRIGEAGAATDAPDALLVADSIEGIVALVQRGVVEFHTWGSHQPRIERPDRITIDLDPDDAVTWPHVVEAAQLVHALFDELKLPAYLKTTGGKGLHVVVPIRPTHDWTTVKGFAKRIAMHLAFVFPERFTATLAKQARKGKIFIDYLRNAEEATAVAAWSVRARPGAPVSMPLLWDELSAKVELRGDHFHIENAAERLDSGAQHEWSAMPKQQVSLSKKTLELLSA